MPGLTRASMLKSNLAKIVSLVSAWTTGSSPVVTTDFTSLEMPKYHVQKTHFLSASYSALQNGPP